MRLDRFELPGSCWTGPGVRKIGVKIIAYPCNQFGGQEPGTNKEIKEYQKKYKVKFAVMDKIEVNGANADPAYKYLRENSDLNGGNIPWNFAKFLVNANGDVVAFYGPQKSPDSLKKDIDSIIAWE